MVEIKTLDRGEIEIRTRSEESQERNNKRTRSKRKANKKRSRSEQEALQKAKERASWKRAKKRTRENGAIKFDDAPRENAARRRARGCPVQRNCWNWRAWFDHYAGKNEKKGKQWCIDLSPHCTVFQLVLLCWWLFCHSILAWSKTEIHSNSELNLAKNRFR